MDYRLQFLQFLIILINYTEAADSNNISVKPKNEVSTETILENREFFPHAIDLLWLAQDMYATIVDDDNKLDFNYIASVDTEPGNLITIMYAVNKAIEATISFFVCSRNPFPKKFDEDNEDLVIQCKVVYPYIFYFAQTILDYAVSQKLPEKIDALLRKENVHITDSKYTAAQTLRRLIKLRKTLEDMFAKPKQLKCNKQKRKFECLVKAIASKLKPDYDDIVDYFEMVKYGKMQLNNVTANKLSLQVTRKIWEESTEVIVFFERGILTTSTALGDRIFSLVIYESTRICHLLGITDVDKCGDYVKPLNMVRIDEEAKWNKSDIDKPDIVWKDRIHRVRDSTCRWEHHPFFAPDSP